MPPVLLGEAASVPGPEAWSAAGSLLPQVKAVPVAVAVPSFCILSVQACFPDSAEA